MDPASSERSTFREALADVPQKPSRGHCCNGFLHCPNAHAKIASQVTLWCAGNRKFPIILFKSRGI
jgi:hypothetical protein